MNLEFIIIAALVTMVALFFINGVILTWIIKLFKIENPTYKNSFKILALSILAFTIINIIFSIINFGLLSTILVAVASFFVFHYILKKYYQNSWKKSLGVYAIFGIISFLIAMPIVVVARLRIVEPFIVSGETMLPTFKDRDYLLINKFDTSFNRNDVIVFHYPKNQSQFFIKRIVGLPSEKVHIQDGKVFINEKVLNESYYTGSTNGDLSSVLGENEYFVLGDNRNKSYDSRAWGPVTRDLIVGKVF